LGAQATGLRHRRPYSSEIAFAAEITQNRGMVNKVIIVVDKATEMHLAVFHQMREEVPRANLVTLIRRIGDAMNQKEDFPHHS